MKRLPKKLSKKNKDSKIKKRTSCLYTSRCLPTRGGKNDDKSCVKRSKYADESKYVDIFPVIYKEKKYYIRIELLKHGMDGTLTQVFEYKKFLHIESPGELVFQFSDFVCSLSSIGSCLNINYRSFEEIQANSKDIVKAIFERYEQEAPDRETLQEAVQQVKTWDGVIK